MATQREEAIVDIRLSTEDARKEIKALTVDIDKANKTLIDFKGSPEERRKIIADIDAMEAKVQRFQKSIKTDFRVIINGEVAGKNINDLEGAMRQLDKEIRLTTDDAVRFEKQMQRNVIKAKIDELKAPLKDVHKGFVEIGQVGSWTFLKAKVDALNLAIKPLAPGTREFTAAIKQLDAAQSQFDALDKKIKGTSGLWNWLTASVKQFGLLAAGYLGFTALTSQISNIISKNAKLSDSLADIRRVAGLTASEVSELNKQLGQLDTRTSTEGLRQIAIVAGKLGVAKEDIASFTREVDKLVVTLGDELGDADAITTSLGKILNVFEGKVNADNISKLGNAFVVLANKGVATGGFIADFSQRLSGIAKASNISLPTLVGLGAGLEELGQKVESSSTAISKLIVTIGQDIPKAAKIAGAKSVKEIEDFTKLFAEKPQEALIKFAEGLSKNKASFGEIAESFKDAGEEGARVISTLVQLGTKGDFLKEKIDLASEAMQNNTAINEAFEIKNKSFGAELDKLGKKIYSVFTSGTISNFFAEAVISTSSFLSKAKQLPEFIARNSTAFIALAGAVATYYASLIVTTAATLLNTTVTLANAAATRVAAIATAIARSATLLAAAGYNLLTGNIVRATAAMRLFAAASLFNPATLIVAGIAVLAAGIELYSKNTAEAIKLEKEKNDLNKKLAESTNLLTQESEAYNQKISKLNELSPDQQKNIRDEIALKVQSAEATLKQLQADQLKIQQDANKPTVWQKLWNAVSSGVGPMGVMRASMANVEDGIKNSAEEAGKFDDRIKSFTDGLRTFKNELIAVDTTLNSESEAMAINVVTTEQYESKLQKLNTALRLVVKDSVDYVRIQKEISDTKQDFNKDGSLTDTQKKSLEEFKSKITTLREEIRTIRTSMIKEESEREISALTDKYQKEKDLAEKNIREINADEKLNTEQKKTLINATNNLLMVQTENFERQKTEKILEFDRKRSEVELVQDEKNLQEKFDTDIINLTKRFQKKEIKEEEFKRESLGLERKLLEDKLTLNKEFFETEISNLQKNKTAREQELAREFKEGAINQQEYNAAIEDLTVTTGEKQILITRQWGEKNIQLLKEIATKELEQAKGDSAELIDAKNKLRELEFISIKEGSREELQLHIQTITEKRDADLQAIKERLDAERKAHGEETELYKTLAKTREKIQQGANASIEAGFAKHIKKLANEYAKYVALAMNVLQQFERNKILSENNELARDQKANQIKKDRLDKLLDGGIIKREEYDQQISKLDTALDKKKRKIAHDQFVRERNLALIKVQIDTATAMIEALPNYILMAAIGIQGGIMTALIAGQSEPEYKKGGFIAEGPAHEQGGIPVVDPKTKKVRARIEGDETFIPLEEDENAAVISKKTTNRRIEIIKDLIYNDGRNITFTTLPPNFEGRETTTHPAKETTTHPAKSMDVLRDLMVTGGANVRLQKGLVNEEQERTIAFGTPPPSPDQKGLVNHAMEMLMTTNTTAAPQFSAGGFLSGASLLHAPDQIKALDTSRIVETQQIMRNYAVYNIVNNLMNQQAAPAPQSAKGGDTAAQDKELKDTLVQIAFALRKLHDKLEEPLTVENVDVPLQKIEDAQKLKARIVGNATVNS